MGRHPRLSAPASATRWSCCPSSICAGPRIAASRSACFSAESDFGRWLLVAGTALIAGFVGWWLWREKRRDDSAALALILGGALGNIVDRARLGYVVDFADLHFGEWRPFLVFNVGDAAITIGVLLLLVRALLMRDGTAKKKEA